jgi:hypothetical protein
MSVTWQATARRPSPTLVNVGLLMMSASDQTTLFADRWRVLLAQHRALQEELELAVSSFSKPPSRQQAAQLAASAARLEKLSKQVRELVEAWAATQA